VRIVTADNVEPISDILENIESIPGMGATPHDARLLAARIRELEAKSLESDAVHIDDIEQIELEEQIRSDIKAVRTVCGLTVRPFNHERGYNGEVIVKVADLLRLVEVYLA